MRINGTPASRTIVFRGFLEDPKGDPSSVLWFVGDLRTEKAEQVNPCAHMLKILAMLRLIASQVLYPNRGELVWTFPLSKEVFRLQGCLDVVVHGEEDPLKRSYRFMAWSSLHADSRLKYNWAAPGMQLNVAGFSLINGLWVPEEEGEDDRAVKGGEMAELAKSSSHLDGVGAAGIPSPQFCLMTLEPDSVQIERLGEGRKFWFKLEQGGKVCGLFVGQHFISSLVHAVARRPGLALH